jgi:hypothetical protein
MTARLIPAKIDAERMTMLLWIPTRVRGTISIFESAVVRLRAEITQPDLMRFAEFVGAIVRTGQL